ncbi:GTP 3',8-cyclase MoaA [Euzebya sp.]|uniref:GTP 3',8-cyclase MoaA n=1 Tax=Euzebya sp. TaxID=1971409 RepID=UPI00351470B7
MLADQLGRGLDDLRISVTDRCNFRCTYCMPREQFGPDHAFLPRASLLTFEEITRVVRVAAGVGVTKIRLPGGEPLLRRDLHRLVAAVTAVDGITDVAMTTNGVLLPAALDDLVGAGLRRVTVSLDALDQATFAAMADVKVAVDAVTGAIDAALDAGLVVKVNTVVKRGVNEGEILALAEFGRERGISVRFIEFMDVGHTNGWDVTHVVPAEEVVATIAAAHPLSPVVRPGAGPGATAVADRYAYDDGAGEVGVIASVTRPFCRTCVRARLSAVGELFTCLFATRGHDLRAVLRSGADDAELDAELRRIWTGRADRYSELRTLGQAQPEDRVEMSYIGG